jgi:hypothetical protein
VIGVSAIQEGRRFAQFSNSGSNCIDITAPGVDIGSTVISRPDLGFTNSYGRGKRGTSYAAPFVSGVLALMKSIQPEWQAKELYEALLQSVSKTPATNEADYMTLFGRGLVQAKAAVDIALAKRNNQIPQALAFLPEGVGRMAYLGKDDVVPTQVERAPFEGIFSALSIRARNTVYYVALAKSTAKATAFRVFGADGSLREERRTDISSDSRIEAAFTVSSSTPEVIVWKKGKHANLFDIFSLSGIRKIGVKNVAAYTVKHVTTALNSATGLSTVYVLVEKAGETRILSVLPSGEVTASILLPKDVRVGSIAVGNIEGDAALEIVGVNGSSQVGTLTYLDSKGTVIRTVSIDQPVSKHEPSIRLVNMLGDEYPEVLVLSGGPNPILRAFTARGRLEESWRDLMPGQKASSIQLLPLYEVPKFLSL